ncbi:MAG: polysulfide reductase NrfD [Candidatus Eremiobacteraeota bacterium]|nr:polysulfide reductase NrfD [Candidatus Eremiobacteraeota bacterium]
MQRKARSYYGRPILKPHVWQDYIAGYFFLGGLAGASAALGAAAAAQKNDSLARSCNLTAGGGAAVSAVLLIADLGNPERFLNMLRVIKPTSPMNVGTWILSAFGVSSAFAARNAFFRGSGRSAAATTAGVLGIPLATYTAVLIADTAVPVWHEAHRTLPFVFAASAAMSAGAWNSLFVSHRDARAARRLTLVAGVCELAAHRRMVHQLGALLGEPYRIGRAGAYAKAARALTTAAVITTATLGRRYRAFAVLGSLAALAGAACERFSIFHAGTQSALDPKYVVEHQRSKGNHAL